MDVFIAQNGEREIYIDDERIYKDTGISGARTKAVFERDGEKYIIKLGSQSAAEYLFYQTLPDEDKAFFMPIYQGHADIENPAVSYVIQKYVEIADAGELTDAERRAAYDGSIKEIISRYNLGGDVYLGKNWGLVDGAPVIFDYGVNDELEEIGGLSDGSNNGNRSCGCCDCCDCYCALSCGCPARDNWDDRGGRGGCTCVLSCGCALRDNEGDAGGFACDCEKSCGHELRAGHNPERKSCSCVKCDKCDEYACECPPCSYCPEDNCDCSTCLTCGTFGYCTSEVLPFGAA